MTDHFTSENEFCDIPESLYSGDNVSIIATHIIYYISIIGPSHLAKNIQTELRVCSGDYGLHCGIEKLSY